jgi:hypothetical protein
VSLMTKQEEFELDCQVRFEDDQLCCRVETTYGPDNEITTWKFTCENKVVFDPVGCSICHACQQKEAENEQRAESAAIMREEERAHGSD